MLANAGHTTGELLPAVQAILDDVRKNGVTEAELERAKRKVLAGKLREVERIGGFGGKADQLNAYYTMTGDPDYFNEDLARYKSMSPSDVRAAAMKFLPKDRRVELTVLPEGAKPKGAKMDRRKLLFIEPSFLVSLVA